MNRLSQTEYAVYKLWMLLFPQDLFQGGHWSGKFDFSSRSGKSQGILQIGQGNFKYQESQGKVRDFKILAQNMCCSSYFDYLKCEKSVVFFSCSLRLLEAMKSC